MCLNINMHFHPQVFNIFCIHPFFPFFLFIDGPPPPGAACRAVGRGAAHLARRRRRGHVQVRPAVDTAVREDGGQPGHRARPPPEAHDPLREGALRTSRPAQGAGKEGGEGGGDIVGIDLIELNFYFQVVKQYIQFKNLRTLS